MSRGGDLSRVSVPLAGVKPVPAWLDARLNYAYKERFKAAKAKDTKRLEWAEREIERLRVKGGLP